MIKHFCDHCKQEAPDRHSIIFVIPTGQLVPGFSGPIEETWRREFSVCKQCFAGIYSIFKTSEIKKPESLGKSFS